MNKIFVIFLMISAACGARKPPTIPDPDDRPGLDCPATPDWAECVCLANSDGSDSSIQACLTTEY